MILGRRSELKVAQCFLAALYSLNRQEFLCFRHISEYVVFNLSAACHPIAIKPQFPLLAIRRLVLFQHWNIKSCTRILGTTFH